MYHSLASISGVTLRSSMYMMALWSPRSWTRGPGLGFSTDMTLYYGNDTLKFPRLSRCLVVLNVISSFIRSFKNMDARRKQRLPILRQ